MIPSDDNLQQNAVPATFWPVLQELSIKKNISKLQDVSF